MTLKKAISRLRSYLKWAKPEPDDNFYEAIQLGFEALKRLRTNRNFSSDIDLSPLPGEE